MLVRLVNFVFQLFIILIIMDALVSYFLAKYNPIRRLLDRIIDPFLNPIRRILPTFQGLDFSPIVLIIIVEIINYLLSNLLSRIG